MRVVVTSNNKEKIGAVRQVFDHPDVEIIGFKTTSGVPSGQPYGLDGTYQACLTRIENLKNLDISGDYYISIENGIVTLTSDKCTTYHDFPVVVIYDVSNNEYYVEFGQSRRVDLDALRDFRDTGHSSKEVGEFCRDNFKNLSFSRGKIIRHALQLVWDSVKFR